MRSTSVRTEAPLEPPGGKLDCTSDRWRTAVESPHSASASMHAEHTATRVGGMAFTTHRDKRRGVLTAEGVTEVAHGDAIEPPQATEATTIHTTCIPETPQTTAVHMHVRNSGAVEAIGPRARIVGEPVGHGHARQSSSVRRLRDLHGVSGGVSGGGDMVLQSRVTEIDGGWWDPPGHSVAEDTAIPGGLAGAGAANRYILSMVLWIVYFKAMRLCIGCVLVRALLTACLRSTFQFVPH